MTYEYGNDEKEYIFCVKGRPFPCLVSPHLPTPTSSLLDYTLVRDLGLKMTDLQCHKFSFAGYKMRILGKIAVTVQCIHDGVSSGCFHIKANVVLDLAKNLDTECVAGNKMAALLRGEKFPPSPAATPRTPSTSAAPSPAPSVPAAESPRTPPPRARAPQAPRSPPRSPPGFPARPQYAAGQGVSIPQPRPTVPVFSVSDDGCELSPRTANVRALTTAFYNADLKPNIKMETIALKKADPDGDFVDDHSGNKKYKFTNRVVYQYGHGREKCTRMKCYGLLQQAMNNFPNNCGFNKQWLFPDKFYPCGDYCSGGFCSCLKSYNNKPSNNSDPKGGRKKK